MGREPGHSAEAICLTFILPLSYTADLGGIPLAGGRKYAFILDIFASLTQIDTDQLWQYSTLTGMNADAVYSPGEHIFLEEDCTDPSTGLPCGSREDHFAATWREEPAEDMVFILEYAYAPVKKNLLYPRRAGIIAA